MNAIPGKTKIWQKYNISINTRQPKLNIFICVRPTCSTSTDFSLTHRELIFVIAVKVDSYAQSRDLDIPYLTICSTM